MTKEQHKGRHCELHRALDELVADWAAHHPGRFYSKATIMELIHWSHDQTIDPTPPPQRAFQRSIMHGSE